MVHVDTEELGPAPAHGKTLLPIEVVRPLMGIQPGRTPLRALAEWAAVLALIWLQETQLPLWCLPLTLLLIASRQHALLVLMHEAVHHRACRTPWLNELFGELLAWPFFTAMNGFRRNHLAHHRESTVNTPQDPDYARKMHGDWAFPKPRRQIALLLLKDLLLLKTAEAHREDKDAGYNRLLTPRDRRFAVLRAVYAIAALGAITALGAWAMVGLYWVLPFFTFRKAIFRIRSIGDHFPLGTGPILTRTRTILPPWWERLLIAPAGISIHGPHHAYPSVPYYNLRKLHALLLEVPEFRRRAHISPSYWHAVMVECVSGAGRGAATAWSRALESDSISP